MGVRRYTTRLLVLVCLLGDLGGEGGGGGGVPSFGCGKGEFGRGCGPKNWRGCGVLSVGCDGWEWVIWLRVCRGVGLGKGVIWGGMLGMGVFVIGMGWLV